MASIGPATDPQDVAERSYRLHKIRNTATKMLHVNNLQEARRSQRFTTGALAPRQRDYQHATVCRAQATYWRICVAVNDSPQLPKECPTHARRRTDEASELIVDSPSRFRAFVVLAVGQCAGAAPD